MNDYKELEAKITRADNFRMKKKGKSMKLDTMKYLLDKIITGGMTGAYDAIETAYNLGYYAGHNQAIRERKTKKCL